MMIRSSQQWSTLLGGFHWDQIGWNPFYLGGSWSNLTTAHMLFSNGLLKLSPPTRDVITPGHTDISNRDSWDDCIFTYILNHFSMDGMTGFLDVCCLFPIQDLSPTGAWLKKPRRSWSKQGSFVWRGKQNPNKQGPKKGPLWLYVWKGR